MGINIDFDKIMFEFCWVRVVKKRHNKYEVYDNCDSMTSTMCWHKIIAKEIQAKIQLQYKA